MNCNTLLYRQVHPGFIDDGRVGSLAFSPNRDSQELSVYDSDRISAEDSWLHYTKCLRLTSAGVLAVTVGECRSEQLDVQPKPVCNFDEHVLIMFDGGLKKIARKLRDIAVQRGWQYRP